MMKLLVVPFFVDFSMTVAWQIISGKAVELVVKLDNVFTASEVGLKWNDLRCRQFVVLVFR